MIFTPNMGEDTMKFHVRRNYRERIINRLTSELYLCCKTLQDCLTTCEEGKRPLLFTLAFKMNYFKMIIASLKGTSYF